MDSIQNDETISSEVKDCEKNKHWGKPSHENKQDMESENSV
jgi:hypothetical protein